MGALQRLDDIVIGRMVDHRPVARPRQPFEQQRKSLLRAVRDHDLVGRCRAAAPLIMGGDRAAQHHQAERIIAQIAQIGRQRLDCMGIGAGDTGRGGQCRVGPVEQVAAARPLRVGGRRRRMTGGQAGDAARPLPAFQKPFVAQPVEGCGNGRARQAQRSGQFTLARQPHIQSDPPVQHQHPQRLRQLAIGRLRAVLRAPCAQQAQQGRRAKQRSGHEHSSD